MAVKRSAPKQQRAIETREALLLGAARVFARLSYHQARLKDIAAESGISEGALYFHFGNKDQIATALLDLQQERMTAVLTAALAGPEDGLDKLCSVIRGLGALMAADEVVQAGIVLSREPTPELQGDAHDPYFEWIRIARTLLQLGIDDGSVSASIDVDTSAQFLNYVFVGAQVIAGMADGWASLPDRLATSERVIRSLLASPPRTT